MKNNVIRLCIFSLLTVLCFGIVGCGTTDTNYVPIAKKPGSISGTVSTIAGTVASGVLVELTHVSTNAQFVTATDVNGFYLFSDLSDGKYLMRTTKAGFIPFNHVLIISGLHKELSGNLISIDDMNMFFGAGHQYNAAKGYVGTYARTSRYAGLAGASFSISPDLKEALGYQKADYTFDWTATATVVGYAMFYGVTPGKYTLTAAATGYSMSPESFTDIPVNAGEVTQVEFLPTKL